MILDLSEEQQLIQRTASDFADRVLRPAAEALDRKGEFPQAALAQAAKLGLLGVNVASRYGGAEAGSVSYALAILELAKECAATTLAIAVTNMVAEIIEAHGTEDQRERYLPALVSGKSCCGAFALSEPHCGSDATALKTTAKRTEEGWRLNGTKQWITSGDHAGVIIVWARTGVADDRPQISAFLVDKGTPGLTVGTHEDKLGLRGSTTVALTFDDCLLKDDALLGAEGKGFQLAMQALDGGRIGVAAQATGLGYAALSLAKGYACERESFGVPLQKHQAIQWMISDSATELDAARLLLLRAAWLKDVNRPFTQEASMAKLYASEAANRVCYRALQVHGGYGYTRDFAIERLTRDARVTTIYEGTSEIQRMVIGRALVG